MDRLICGDVGYGKTEVAIRAAFKAVQDSKQVAYLARQPFWHSRFTIRFAEDEGFSGECGFDVPFQKCSRAVKRR